ncbi:MAG: NUDIX hydrolase [Paenibacillus sp. RIFOXYA1_FULL_44_5]|nr:MAG: NUDIX hydrolase [Paenibacillus sp. RIFOXYA1_FULL_44_5]
MFKLRLMVNAVLFHNDALLMMKRSPTRFLSPNMWAGIGGHVEPSEIKDPRTACLREIEEETGLLGRDIENFTLQYIIIRQKDNEIRQQFMYTGQTHKTDLLQTPEGELFWVPVTDVLEKPIPYVYRETLQHYFQHGPAPHIWIGSSNYEQTVHQTSVPVFTWAKLSDPQIL